MNVHRSHKYSKQPVKTSFLHAENGTENFKPHVPISTDFFCLPLSRLKCQIYIYSWILAQTGSGLFLHKHVAEIFQTHKSQVDFSQQKS